MKLELLLDKSTIIIALAFVIGTCALIMLKNGLEKFILGGGGNDPHARLKSLFLIIAALIFFALGIVALFETERIAYLLTPHIQDFAVQLTK